MRTLVWALIPLNGCKGKKHLPYKISKVQFIDKNLSLFNKSRTLSTR